jgi:hypothetical protein
MGNWQERMRQIQEEEKRKILAQGVEIRNTRQAQQEARLKSARDADIKAREANEKKAKFLEILDRLKVKQSLEEIKDQVWQNQGKIIEGKTDSNRFARLSYEFETAIPETEHKEWRQRVEITRQEHYEIGGNLSTSYTTVDRSKRRVVAWHKVIMPSYLEVGINYPSQFYGFDAADLYVVDTDISLHNRRFGEFADARFNFTFSTRVINYTDRKGNKFSKEPRPRSGSESSWILDGLLDRHSRTTYTSYILNDHHTMPVVNFKLFHETESVADEFVNHSLAVSSFLRKSQNKLPLQLQEQGKNYRRSIS